MRLKLSMRNTLKKIIKARSQVLQNFSLKLERLYKYCNIKCLTANDFIYKFYSVLN